jgi:hypothetical protein
MPTIPDPPLKFVTYVTFPKIIGEILRNDSEWGSEFRYTNVFPKTPAEVPCVVYNMIRRVPGMDGIETRAPRIRQEIINEDGSWLQIWSQWMTCLFQFDCCAESRTEAEDLAYRLDAKIRESKGVLLQLGVSEMWFDEQLRDDVLPRIEGVETSSLRWGARLDQIEFQTWPGIQEVRCRVFSPQADAVEALVRGSDLKTKDALAQTHISKIIYVSDPSPSGIARTDDYFPDVDFEVFYDFRRGKTALLWLEPGKRPAPGATYYVRYLYWNAFTELHLPSISTVDD